MIYRFKTALFFNNSVDIILDEILISCIKSGIESVDTTASEIIFVFNNGIKYSAWNLNKYYAWLDTGTVFFPNGKKYCYNETRPSAKTMYLLKEGVRDYMKKTFK